MMRLIALLVLSVVGVDAQTTKADLLKLADELDASIQSDDWAHAVQISAALKLATHEARNQSLTAVGKELADSILTWLPANTETFVVAQQPFKVAALDDRTAPTALEAARFYVLLLFSAAEKEKLLSALAGRTMRLAAIARRLGEEPDVSQAPGAPIPLGMVPYQGCGVYAFTAPVEESIFGRPADESIMGHRVWVSKGSQNDTPDRETYLVSMIKLDLMMACNNREFFEQMVIRMGAPAQNRALPANLAEWKYVDRGAPLYGICHYTNKTAMIANMGEPGKDLGATGITIEFGLASGAARAHMISKSNPWIAMDSNPEFHGAAKSREEGTGVWELAVEEKPEAANMAAFVIMAYLGFVVLL